MEQEIELKRFQNNLPTIRKLYGWTIEELATKIGVTKQTISNIENRKTELTRIQYIAIRAVFETEASTRPPEERDFLVNIISKLIDSDNPNNTAEQEDNLKLYV